MASRHTIPGSERQALEGAQAIGPARPDERIEVTLRLRAKTPVAHALTAIGAADDTQVMTSLPPVPRTSTTAATMPRVAQNDGVMQPQTPLRP